MGSLNSRAMKTGLAERIRGKSGGYPLDKVRYDHLAEVKGRFNSCLPSKCSVLSVHTGLALKPPRF